MRRCGRAVVTGEKGGRRRAKERRHTKRARFIKRIKTAATRVNNFASCIPLIDPAIRVT